MTARIGDWMDLGDGRQFWPLDPRPAEVRLDDVATALSHVCRFGGRCREWYSVAQHSLLVMEIVETTHPDIALQALLHDAAEAYLGDVVTPLKGDLRFRVEDADGYVVRDETFREAEQRLHTAILIGLGVPLPSVDDDFIIAQADMMALATESRDLMYDPEWARRVPAWSERVVPLPADAARRAFLAAFDRLMKPVGGGPCLN